MCARPASCFTLMGMASMMSNSANIIISFSVFESSNGGVTKAVDKRPHYVGVASLSVFRGNLYWVRYIRD